MKINEKQTDNLNTAPDEHIERDHQTYLRVAEVVLASALSPLKAREIVERGIEQGLFGDHCLSRTPEKSMQARLSMDILNRSNRSQFVRTERGKFALRSKVFDRSQPREDTRATDAILTSEYIAERRVLRPPREEVLCAPESAFRDILTFQGIDADAAPILDRLLSNRNVSYVPRSEAEVRNDAKQFVTYVLVQCDRRLLFFKRSYLSRAAEFLRGSKCIGFGGHVSAADADILSLTDRGLSACARRELIEELHLPDPSGYSKMRRQGVNTTNTGVALPRSPSRATQRLFHEVPLERLGVLNDDSSEVGRRHVAVIYRAWLSDWNLARRLQKGESSIKGLGWIDLSNDKVDISDFEYWSQLCLRTFYPSTAITKSKFKILSASRIGTERVIVVAGRIGSGKSETAGYLSQTLSWPLIKSSVLLQELMGAPSMGEIGRREFQCRALDFIRSDGGPARLGALIETRIRELQSARCIVDGIRHLSTYENLTYRFGGNVCLLYMMTPPDVAYDMYRAREGTLACSYREFLEIYDAPVESEIPSLGRKAQIYIYNSFGMEAFRRTLDDVATWLSRIACLATLRTIGQGKGGAHYPNGVA